MNKESQVRGCCNIIITFIYTNQEAVQALPRDEHMNTGRNSK